MSDQDSTVFIVDDDVSVREALAGLVEAMGWRAQAYATAQDFLGAAPVYAPNCLVLDVGLPDLSGLDVQALVARERSETPIIFITGYGDVPTSVRAMKAGAVEFLTKPVADDDLLEAVSGALQRSREALAQSSELQRLRTRHNTLSRREKEVMGLVVQGLMNKQVAWQLGITEITVKAHRGKVMEKMQVRSLADLVKLSQRLEAEAS